MIPPSVSEFAVKERAQLLARVAELEANLRNVLDTDLVVKACIRQEQELMALKQPSAGVDERDLFEAGINPHCRKRNEHGDYVAPEIQDRWDGWQARAQLAAPAWVPDGCRLVPVEPTEAMLRAGLQYDSEQDPNNPDSRAEELKIDYGLMLAAAPTHAPTPSCSVERPCIPCFSDIGECIDPTTAPTVEPAHSDDVSVPRGLMEELRDAANEARNEADRPHRISFFSALVGKADSLLNGGLDE